MSNREIEKRLTAVEHEIARLKGERLPAAPAHPIQALERIHGIVEDDDAFQEAIRLGRKWRNSQSQTARSSKATRYS